MQVQFLINDFLTNLCITNRFNLFLLLMINHLSKQCKRLDPKYFLPNKCPGSRKIESKHNYFILIFFLFYPACKTYSSIKQIIRV